MHWTGNESIYKVKGKSALWSKFILRWQIIVDSVLNSIVWWKIGCKKALISFGWQKGTATLPYIWLGIIYIYHYTHIHSEIRRIPHIPAPSSSMFAFDENLFDYENLQGKAKLFLFQFILIDKVRVCKTYLSVVLEYTVCAYFSTCVPIVYYRLRKIGRYGVCMRRWKSK